MFWAPIFIEVIPKPLRSSLWGAVEDITNAASGFVAPRYAGAVPHEGEGKVQTSGGKEELRPP